MRGKFSAAAITALRHHLRRRNGGPDRAAATGGSRNYAGADTGVGSDALVDRKRVQLDTGRDARRRRRPALPGEQVLHRDGELAADHRLQRRERLAAAGNPKDRKPMAWARAMETLRDALLAAQVTDYRDLVQAVT